MKISTQLQGINKDLDKSRLLIFKDKIIIRGKNEIQIKSISQANVIQITDLKPKLCSIYYCLQQKRLS